MNFAIGISPVGAICLGPERVWPTEISLLSGTGYAGSVFQSTIPGQWYADDVPVSGATGATYTQTVATEAARIRCGSSNVIQMWTPKLYGAKILFWVDPCDTSTLTLVNSSIVELYDKGGSGAKFVQQTASAAPLIVQDGSRAYISPNNGLYMTATGLNLTSDKLRFSVLAGDNSGNTSQQRALFGQEGGFTLGRGFDGAQSFGAFIRSAAGDTVLSGSWATNRIVDFIATGAGAVTKSPLVADTSGAGDFRAGTSSTYLFRGYQSGITTVRYWTGVMREMIIWADDMAGQDARIQGYLAHRWGMADVLLPAGHPYKTTAPRAA